MDEHDNAPGPGPEAIYASRVELEPGTTLDLAGRRIYYGALDPSDADAPDSGVTIIDSIGGGGLIPLGGRGDVDGDGAVNGLDVAAFVANFQASPIRPGGGSRDCADLDGDGSVGLRDAETLIAALLGR